jgi:hypothetical protein
MFNARTTPWDIELQRTEGINYIVEKPTTAIKDGEVVIIPTKTKLSKKYDARSNSKEFNLDTVEVTEFVSIGEFKFKDNGQLYQFFGNQDGTFSDPIKIVDETSQDITFKEVSDVLLAFKESGDVFDEPEAFDLVYNVLSQRWADMNQFKEDVNQPELLEFFKALISEKMDPTMDETTLSIVATELYMKDFKNLKCK